MVPSSLSFALGKWVYPLCLHVIRFSFFSVFLFSEIEWIAVLKCGEPCGINWRKSEYVLTTTVEKL